MTCDWNKTSARSIFTKLIEQINFSLLLLCIPDIKKRQAAQRKSSKGGLPLFGCGNVCKGSRYAAPAPSPPPLHRCLLPQRSRGVSPVEAPWAWGGGGGVQHQAQACPQTVGIPTAAQGQQRGWAKEQVAPTETPTASLQAVRSKYTFLFLATNDGKLLLEWCTFCSIPLSTFPESPLVASQGNGN